MAILIRRGEGKASFYFQKCMQQFSMHSSQIEYRLFCTRFICRFIFCYCAAIKNQVKCEIQALKRFLKNIITVELQLSKLIGTGPYLDSQVYA